MQTGAIISIPRHSSAVKFPAVVSRIVLVATLRFTYEVVMPVEPPYGIIAPKLKGGKVVPFLGAGASLGNRGPDARFDPDHPLFLPKADELARVLAEDSGFPSLKAEDREDLAKVSSYYVGVSGDGRPTLRQRLRYLLNPMTDPAAPSSVMANKPMTLHRLLAALPTRQVIVTTNYDSLIEEAFNQVKRPYHLVIYPADRPELVNQVLWWPHGESPQPVEANKLAEHLDLRDATAPSVIFKMHGTRHPSDETHDHFVITEEDYLEFLSRMANSAAIPPVFIPVFQERSFLFLGYGLRDWNLRLLLRNLPGQTDKRLRSWAIQKYTSELETALWQKRDVEIYPVDVNEFAEKIASKLGISS